MIEDPGTSTPIASAPTENLQAKRDQAKETYLRRVAMRDLLRQVFFALLAAALAVAATLGGDNPKLTLTLYIILGAAAAVILSAVFCTNVPQKQIEYEQEARKTGVSESELFSL